MVKNQVCLGQRIHTCTVRPTLMFSTFLDCGRVSVNDASDTSISLHWNCPCSNWIGVDKYEFEFMAEDGEIDYTHTSRVEGKRK